MTKKFLKKITKHVNDMIDKSLMFHHRDLHKRLDRLENIEKMLIRHYEDDML